MELIIRGWEPNSEDVELFSALARAVASELVDPDGHVVIAAADFVEAVREWVNDPNYAAAYTEDRVGATVAAKTIPRDDSSTVVIFNAALAVGDPELALHTAHHEGLHAALHERSEDGACIRSDLELSGAARDLGVIASIAIEEYRVELALAERAAGSTRWRDALTDMIGAVSDEFAAVWLSDVDITEAYQRQLTAFQSMLHSLAYASAEDPAGAGSLPDGLSSRLRERWIGDGWHQVASLLAEVDSADTPMDREALRSICIRLAGYLRSWLSEVGVDLSDLDDGFRVDYNRHDWVLA